jgi:hypothetical protein
MDNEGTNHQRQIRQKPDLPCLTVFLPNTAASTVKPKSRGNTTIDENSGITSDVTVTVIVLDVTGLEVASPGQFTLNCHVPVCPKPKMRLNTPLVKFSFVWYTKPEEFIAQSRVTNPLNKHQSDSFSHVFPPRLSFFQ